MKDRVRAWVAVALLGAGACQAQTPPAVPAVPTPPETATPPASAPSGAAPAAVVGATAPRLLIDAPDPLRELLQQYLDLARLPQLAGDAPLDDTELTRLLAAAPAQARELLETEGYFNAVVQIERLPSAPDARSPAVRLRVEPGPQARIARLRLQVQGDLPQRAEDDATARTLSQSLQDRFGLQPGQTFRNAAWAQAKAALLTRLRSEGYSAALLVGTSARVAAEPGTVDLLVIADSGPLFRAGDLVVQGLQSHDEQTVRNLAGFERGDALTEERLLDFQERLQVAGLFDSVVVTADADPENAGAATVTVRLREQPLQQATVALGVSANTGARTTLEHTHRRPFGAALTLRNKLEWGQELQSWEGDLSTHPGPGFYRNLAGGAAQRQITDTDVVSSLRLRIGRTQDTKRIERLYFLELERATLTTDTLRDVARAVTVNYHGVWRDLDSVVLPTEGLSLAAQGGVGEATSLLGGSGPFSRVWARFTGYKPLGASWYGTARVELGQVFTRGEVGVPQTQLFRAGGDDSVRGYDYRSLGPPDADGVVVGGRVLATASVEVARPISARLPSVWWAAFVDAGRAADSWNGFSAAWGYGLGLRWRSPVGPLRVDLAYGDEARQWRMHLNVGIAF